MPASDRGSILRAQVRRRSQAPGRTGACSLAYALNELAWSIGSLALAVLVYRRTGSAVGAAAFFLAAQFVPALISPALVARLDQRAAAAGAAGRCTRWRRWRSSALAWLAAHFVARPAAGRWPCSTACSRSTRPAAGPGRHGGASPRPADLLREGNALLNAAFSVCFMAGPAIGALRRGRWRYDRGAAGRHGPVRGDRADAGDRPGVSRPAATGRARPRPAARRAAPMPARRARDPDAAGSVQGVATRVLHDLDPGGGGVRAAHAAQRARAATERCCPPGERARSSAARLRPLAPACPNRGADRARGGPLGVGLLVDGRRADAGRGDRRARRWPGWPTGSRRSPSAPRCRSRSSRAGWR